MTEEEGDQDFILVDSVWDEHEVEKTQDRFIVVDSVEYENVSKSEEILEPVAQGIEGGRHPRKYFNIVDLCGILPYKRMRPHLCGRIINYCISSPFLYYIQYAQAQLSFVMTS